MAAPIFCVLECVLEWVFQPAYFVSRMEKRCALFWSSVIISSRASRICLFKKLNLRLLASSEEVISDNAPQRNSSGRFSEEMFFSSDEGVETGEGDKVSAHLGRIPVNL